MTTDIKSFIAKQLQLAVKAVGNTPIVVTNRLNGDSIVSIFSRPLAI